MIIFNFPLTHTLKVHTCKFAFSVSSSRIMSSSSWRCSASISAIKVSGESGTAEMRSPLCNFWQYCAIKECSSVKVPPISMPMRYMEINRFLKRCHATALNLDVCLLLYTNGTFLPARPSHHHRQNERQKPLQPLPAHLFP